MPRRRVLLVEKSPTARADLQRSLAQAGIDVTAVADPAAARRTGAPEHYAAAVLDGDAARALVPWLRSETAHVPVLLLEREPAGAAPVPPPAAHAPSRDGDAVIAELERLFEEAGLPRPRRVLCADDSPTFLAWLDTNLREAGFETVLATSGEEALRRLEEGPAPDCVLLDLAMSGIGGDETCRRVRANPAWRDLPVVILTSHDDRASIIGALGAGADDHVAKSGDFEVLRSRLLVQLRRREFEVENARIREELARERMAAVEARAARELAEARADLLVQIRAKSEALERNNVALEAALNALRQSEERFRVAFEQAPYGIVIRTPGGRVLEANASASRMLGRSATELAAQPLESLLDAPEGDGLPEVGPFVARWRRSDGETVWTEGASGLVRDAHGEPSLAVILLQDVTSERTHAAERARLEEQLHHSQRMEAVGRLASGIAHDFNNVLAVIASFADLVERRVKTADPTAAGWVSSIRGATERGAALTRQLLLFSRKEAATDEALALEPAVEDLLAMLSRTLGEDIELATDIRPDVRPVRLSRSQLDQVLMNLAVNARDAMPKGGRFRVEAWNEDVDPRAPGPPVGPAPGTYVRVRVSDTGTGMTPEVASHIFEPFFTTKESGRGTGLGLSIVYGIATKAGGAVSVSTAPGKGTTFELLLPAAEAPAATAPPAEPEVSGPCAGERILLVEDEAMIRRVATVILEERGYHVHAAEDGVAALEVVERTGLPDAIVTDVLMPRMNGVDLCRELERRHPGLPVVFVSGFTAHHLDGFREEDPRVRFLAKPFDSEALIAALSEALAAARAHAT